MLLTHRLQPQLTRLRRRHFARVAVGYAVVAWLLLQIASVVLPGLNIPGWTMTLFIVLTGAGFPIALILAWAQDRSPSGEAAPALVAPAGVAASPAGPSVAVLPFADLSPARDQEWFCDGIAEELLGTLCGLPGLRAAARGSSFQFKGRAIDSREAARTLGVSTLLEGSVRKAGERVRVSARLISGEDGYELWSESFDRSLQDIFAIQEEIAQAVVRALRLRLSSSDATRLQRSGTRNTAAYEMYLRGREFFRAFWDPRQWTLARQMFKGAIELDPKFAQAHAGLADVCFFIVQWHLDDQRKEALSAEALAASDEAMRLDPDLAEANQARGNLMSLAGRNDDAEAAFRRAIALNPALADSYYFYARHLQAAGQHAQAAEMYEEAARRSPDDYQPLALVTPIYRALKEPEKLRSSALRGLQVIERHLRLHPEDVRALYLGGILDINAGNRARGLERLTQAVELQPEDFATLYNVACGFTTAGELDRALDTLERAFAKGQGFRRWLEHDPDMDPLRALPRFQRVLESLQP